MRLQAPFGYVQSAWQQILGQITDAFGQTFFKGQDVRLINGERFSLKSPAGTEVFLTVDDASILNLIGQLGAKTTVSSAGTLTLAAGGHYVFTGTTATWTLPAVSGNTNKAIGIKNRGSGNLAVQRASTDHIYDTSAVTSITVAAGAAVRLGDDGTYWNVE